VGSAGRLLNGQHLRRLPVVDPDGHLLGIVSRRDLLRLFLRPDDEIAAEVRGVLTDVLLTDLITAIDGVAAAHNELIVNPGQNECHPLQGRAPCSGDVGP
jgi:CBS domain-containing protein